MANRALDLVFRDKVLETIPSDPFAVAWLGVGESSRRYFVIGMSRVKVIKMISVTGKSTHSRTFHRAM